VREDVIVSLHNNNFLQTLNQAWNDHHTSMAMIKDIFQYLDRVYVQQNELDSVYDLGLIIFRDQVVHHDCIRDHMRETLLSMFVCALKREVIDLISIKNTCQMLMVLGIYEEDFERLFLEQLVIFYLPFEFFYKPGISMYDEQQDLDLENEIERAIEFMDRSSIEKLKSTIKLKNS
jgi:cullin 3